MLKHSLKGPNGIVPCGVCKNVVGRCRPFHDPYLVHIHSSEYHRFDKHTPESFTELAHHIKHIAENSPGDLRMAEMTSGLKYSVDEVPWDDEVRGRLKPPLGAYTDWVHHFLASGGLAQYEINGLVLKLNSVGISLADIDAWKNTVRLPHNHTKLSNTFFVDRVKPNPNGHIKAFASEAMTVVLVLGFFIDYHRAVLVHGELQPYFNSFDLLRVIICIFQRGDRHELPTLRSAMQSHHEVYAQLYHCIAKIHGQSHIVDYWEYWGPLLSCFGPERHHKLFKRVCSYSFNKFERSSLAHDVRTWICDFRKDELFMAMHLCGKRRPCNFSLPWPGCSRPIIINEWSGSLNTEAGMLSKGDR